MSVKNIILLFVAKLIMFDATGSITISIKDFGAVGNGKNDDSPAINKCFKKAANIPRCTILIPPGTYKLSNTIILDFFEGDIIIEGVINSKGERPMLITEAFANILFVKGYFDNHLKGSITIKNLNFKASNPPYSKNHPWASKKPWNCGIRITDKKNALIDNVIVEGIYGNGIYIATTRQTETPASARFDDVVIKNSIIKNCWGHNLPADDYGDGIYLSNVSKAQIINNKIINDFKITKQLGRAGIVIEYMAENVLIELNKIFGYDRCIHIEADYGGHTINRNNLLATDLGIVIYSPYIQNHNKPVKISNNTFTNSGMPKNNTLIKYKGTMSISDRAFIDFVAPNNSRSGSYVQANKFTIDGQYDYFSNSILNIRANNITLSQNNYTVKNPSSLKYSIGYYIYSTAFINKEFFSGVNLIKFLKKNSNNNFISSFSKNNTLNGAKIIIE